MQPYGQSSSSTVTVYAIKENVHADKKTEAAYKEFKKLLSSKDANVDFKHLEGDWITAGDRVHANRPVFIAPKGQELFEDTSKKKTFVFKELSQKDFDKKFPKNGAGKGILSIDISDFTKTTATTKDIAAKTLSPRTGKTATGKLDIFDSHIASHKRAVQPIASERKSLPPNFRSEQLAKADQQARAEIRVTNDLKKLEKSVKQLEAYNRKSGIGRFFSFGQPGKLIKEILTTLTDLRTDLETYPIDTAWEQKDQTIKQRLFETVTKAQKAWDPHEKKLGFHTRCMLGDNKEIILYQVATKTEKALIPLRKNNTAVLKEEEVVTNPPSNLSKEERREQLVMQATKLVPLYIKNYQLATNVLKKDSKNQEALTILKHSLKQLKSALERIQKDYNKRFSSYQKDLSLYNQNPTDQQVAKLNADFKRLKVQNDLLNQGNEILKSGVPK